MAPRDNSSKLEQKLGRFDGTEVICPTIWKVQPGLSPPAPFNRLFFFAKQRDSATSAGGETWLLVPRHTRWRRQDGRSIRSYFVEMKSILLVDPFDIVGSPTVDVHVITTHICRLGPIFQLHQVGDGHRPAPRLL
ncbi:hypothetical protein EUGRSUZ_B00379 [Eucalyptus grandis]|uniref:Uncharacterized protein n=2 Tax=Eucalyptus grandis TaxID=71139 RepID=A0ACC3LLY5_EUCGR|nr:hypothetical protein EUGRSUZ_B00379 [Eucalyptus grandis]